MAILSKPVLAWTALASIAHALPQKPDFAAIAAAPTVASGPSAVDTNPDGQEQASLYTSFTVTGATAAPSATAAKRSVEKRDQTYSSDVTDSSYNARFGHTGQLTTVNQGVTYWINGGSTHNFFGNINNNGRIFVSQTAYLRQNPYAGGQTSDWVGHDNNNGNLQNAAGALIQLNDYGSASAPTYDWYIRSMVNNGTVQWCGRGDTGGSTYQMYNDVSSTNNGLISFEQFFDNKGASFVWRNPTIGTSSNLQNLYNNGAFRIINVNYHNVQNIYGNGCWQIGKGGILYLEDGSGAFQNPTAGPTFPGQSITFQDSSAVLHMDTAVYSRNSNFGAKVYNYGQGNAIEFYQTIKSFNYNSGSGILNVAFVGSNQVNVNIGTGYDSSKFAQRRNPQKYASYNAIFYDGAAPSQAVPDKCQISAPVCSDLSGGLPPVSGPSSTSTSKPATSTSTSQSATSTSSVPTTTSSVPTTSSTTTTSTKSSTSSSVPSTTSSAKPSTTAPPTTTVPPSTTAPSTPKTCPADPSYSPYYPALSTGYTTNPALTGTTTAGQPCPTTPEDGTYCGFINPLDPCAPQPDGYGPVPTPDTASAFLAYDKLHSLASAAPTVVPAEDGTQYQQVFKDLDAATSAQSYLGLYTLKEYDVAQCADKCDCTELCTAFNIYAERDPSLRPSVNDTAPTVWGNYCPNPHSMTSFKCTLWGSNIDASTATNKGQNREEFQVVITASDGYDKTNVTTPPTVPSSSSQPTDLKSQAIDAPQFWLGTRFFPGPFNPYVCSDFAQKQSAANSADQKVKFFNAYYLHKNGSPWGTQCALYNSVLDGGKYATYRGSDEYECKQSWGYTLA